MWQIKVYDEFEEKKNCKGRIKVVEREKTMTIRINAYEIIFVFISNSVFVVIVVVDVFLFFVFYTHIFQRELFPYTNTEINSVQEL